MMALIVGQKLWFVPSDRRGNPYKVTVEKVGRKWAYIGSRLRIDIETMWADGGEYSSPGRCYFSQEDHAREVSLIAAWHSFRQKLDHFHYPPKGIDESIINHVIKALRLNE
jgi:hypothetical protein